MALTKSILKLTETDAVVKIAGATGTSTISLTTDILDSNQSLSGGTQTVNIIGVTWTGHSNNLITVTRNSTRVLSLLTDAGDTIAFDGQTLPPENTANTFDIVIGQEGNQNIELYIKLRKVSGYAPKVETAVFGAYDNESVVGS